MKIAPNSCIQSAAASEKISKQQQHKPTSTVLLSASYVTSNNNENVCNNNATATAIQATTKMTDERNSSNNTGNKNISSNTTNNNHNSNSERLIAEATKILLKNGLNGTNAAAAAAAATAALLNARVTFQLPAPPTPTAVTWPPPAHSATTTTAAIAAVVSNNAGCQSSNQRAGSLNNGLSPSLSSTSSTTATNFSSSSNKKAMAAATAATTAAHLGSTVAVVKTEEIGVLDYTLAASNATPSSAGINNNHKFHTNSSDIGRNPISSAAGSSAYGGRLQFFKDGKFILELARAKEGEKGGWVSVPRKLFRSPSATSSTVTPTSATSTAYPKNESSTSLSFSDDNSSIQSSPWQREPCWKQSTPRRGISKEMSLHYFRPKCLTLTTPSLLLSQRKRRRPFDIATASASNAVFQRTDMSTADVDNNTTLKAEAKPNSPPNVREEDCKLQKDIEDVTNVDEVVDKPASSSKNINGSSSDEDEGCSSSSTATLTGNDSANKVLVERKTPTPTVSASDKEIISEELKTKQEDNINAKDIETNDADEENKDTTLVEKMNTSDEDEAMCTPMDETPLLVSSEVNGNASENNINQHTKSPSTTATMLLATGGEVEKRLKKLKIRAKLTTIVKQLTDRMPVRLVHLSKTPLLTASGNGGAVINNVSNSHAHKVSPPSSATSRLVEYHQQHVSPRKRILREFEKVSLEDNAAAAGGKRSRAKGNTTTTSTATATQYRSGSAKSPQASGSTTPMTMNTANTLNTNGSGANHQNATTNTKSKTNTAPTRLYSSYSIHSLLGGSSSTTSTKKSNDQAIVSNINYHQQQQQQQYPDPSYLRAMLASPKSPEGNSSCGGKSPSNSGSKKRSPPYAVSPMHEAHSRSPTVAAHSGSMDYGHRSPRATPPEPAASYKMRFAAADHSIAVRSPTATTLNAATTHSSSHHLQQHQGFYSPYMMSPKYVPAPSTSISPNSSQTSTRHASAFSSATLSSSAAVSTSTLHQQNQNPQHHIPNASASAPQRELSPLRSSTASPRDSTPRTVPKKTASIRRQFASPTANSTTSSCSSPSGERNSEEAAAAVQQDRKTPINSNAHAQQLLQRGSPSAPPTQMGAAAVASALHCYMYPPPPSNGQTASPHHPQSSAAASQSSAAAAAVAAAAYNIPSVVPPAYYLPYISLAALRPNPMWMHHYPSNASPVLPPHHPAAVAQAQQAAAAAARFAPQFHNFPYNGAVAYGGPQASAAAAAHHQQMLAQAALHGSLGMATGSSTGGGGSSPHSSKMTDHTTDLSTVTRRTTNTANTARETTTAAASANTIFRSSIKDEHSSDVPLNLSKH